jgi:hypothetical protein
VVCEGSTNRANVFIFQFLLQLFAEGKRVVDGVSHGAYGAFVEEWYSSTDHVDAVVGGDLRVDVGADCLHCCLCLA